MSLTQVSRGPPVLNADGQITIGNGSRSASEPYTVSGGCLFLVQAVRLLLLVGLIMSLTQVSGMLA